MMWPEYNPPTMTVNPQSASHTITFTAGIIAHESCHSRHYQEGLRPDPKNFEAIRQEELSCIRYEIQLLKAIGAQPEEIRMAVKQDGTHFDVDKDGDYDLADFEKMNW